jgi:hypothetical protein
MRSTGATTAADTLRHQACVGLNTKGCLQLQACSRVRAAVLLQQGAAAAAAHPCILILDDDLALSCSGLVDICVVQDLYTSMLVKYHCLHAAGNGSALECRSFGTQPGSSKPARGTTEQGDCCLEHSNSLEKRTTGLH